MITYQRKAGTTDVSVVVRIIDSTDGTPETGVVAATGGLVLEYRRELEAEVSLATITDLALLTTAHTDKGILHIGDGYYRVDLPDAACAAGQVGVLVHGVATGMVVIGCYIQLVAYDPFDTVRLGLTALPNAAADAAGGLVISDAGGLDADAQRTDVAAILVDTGTTLDARIPAALVSGRIDASVGAMAAAVVTAAAIATGAVDADALAADAVAEIADGVWDEDATGHQTGGTFGQAIGDPAASTETLYKAIVTDPAGTNIAADVIALKAETALIVADTNELQGDWVDGGRLDLLLDAILLDTGTTLDGRIPAALVGGRMDSSVGAAAANTLTASALAADAAAEIADAVWDELQADHVTAGSFGLVASEIADILVDTAEIGAAGAGLTALATQASVNAIDDFLDTEIAAILEDTGTTLDDFVDDLEARLTAALATQLTAHSLGVGRGVVDALSTTTAVIFKTVNGAAASAVDDFYNGRHIIFTSGALLLQATSISDYTGASVTATVPALTSAPADDVTFIIV